MKKSFVSAMLPWLVLLFLSTSASAYLEPGTTAPDFKLYTPDGRAVRLSELESRFILLVLGTTWCRECTMQLAELQKAGSFLRNAGGTVVEVFIRETADAVRSSLAGKNMAMPYVALVDDGRVQQGYGVYHIPRLLLLDQSRRVLRDGPMMAAEKLIRAIKKVDS